ncbi:GNAT family N-acetyltransferase [Mesorhizobium opportunistum]|uniref:GNAT family N-acetyltransferase n=1 Tax=Mesorhizobium opportunistum TaxID=593909 RepID=UPI00333930C2
MSVTLRRVAAADIPFIMRTERLEGYEALVGRWEEARHMAALADSRYAYFVAEADGTPLGFAILRDWASPEHATLVERVAVAEPGRGLGTAMMRAVVDAAFTETDVHRLWICCFPENLRARRSYETIGFVAEGVARSSAFFRGEHRDELVLSLLRPEWDARARRPLKAHS